MDERRFRAALEAIAKTIYCYGEDEIFAALGVIADRFGWELAKRDPGPEPLWSDTTLAVFEAQRQLDASIARGRRKMREQRDDIESGEVWPEDDEEEILTAADCALIRDTFGPTVSRSGKVIDMTGKLR